MRLSPFVVAMLVVVLASCSAGDPGPAAEGRSIYGDVCSGCHGNRGQGGVGPPLDTVVETWPSCDDQIEWIVLGSDGWRVEHGDTYGTSGKPVTGGMPSHRDQLTVEEVRQVAAFERSAYGGLDPNVALAECGADGPG